MLHQSIGDSLRIWEAHSASLRVEQSLSQLKGDMGLANMEAASRTLGQSLKTLPEKQQMLVAEAVDHACQWLCQNPQVMVAEAKIIVSFFRSAAVGEDHRQWQMVVEEVALLLEAKSKCSTVLEKDIVMSELKPVVSGLSQALRSCDEKSRIARCKKADRQENLQSFVKTLAAGMEEAREVLRRGAEKLMVLHVQHLNEKTVPRAKHRLHRVFGRPIIGRALNLDFISVHLWEVQNLPIKTYAYAF